MSERLPGSEPKITREEAMAAYKRFVDQGAASPDSLNPNDSEVQEANRLFDEWRKQEDVAAKGDENAEKRMSFLTTKFYIDAGFTDKAYLEEVLQWLRLDADDIEKKPDDLERTKLRKEYAEEITKIRGLLRKVQ